MFHGGKTSSQKHVKQQPIHGSCCSGKKLSQKQNDVKQQPAKEKTIHLYFFLIIILFFSKQGFLVRARNMQIRK